VLLSLIFHFSGVVVFLIFLTVPATLFSHSSHLKSAVTSIQSSTFKDSGKACVLSFLANILMICASAPSQTYQP
jgi:hypothetical protein